MVVTLSPADLLDCCLCIRDAGERTSRVGRDFWRTLHRRAGADAVPDEAGQGPIAASPYATGGGGTRLEHRLGTVLLVRLLTAGPVFELDERAPDRVAFQQAPTANVDDLVVTARAADG